MASGAKKAVGAAAGKARKAAAITGAVVHHPPYLDIIVPAGAAAPAPPLGPALSQVLIYILLAILG